uniref:Uncharacterized protein n=1 Tax=Plectus sambesii TaxID=2011161 RepID=A0A914VMG9_9BILA
MSAEKMPSLAALAKSFVNDVIKPFGTLKEPPPTKVHPLEPRHPYGFEEKIRMYPWRYLWRHSVYFRSMTYSAAIWLYFSYKITKIFNEPEYARSYWANLERENADIVREHKWHWQKHEDHHHFHLLAHNTAKDGKALVDAHGKPLVDAHGKPVAAAHGHH